MTAAKPHQVGLGRERGQRPTAQAQEDGTSSEEAESGDQEAAMNARRLWPIKIAQHLWSTASLSLVSHCRGVL